MNIESLVLWLNLSHEAIGFIVALITLIHSYQSMS